MRAEAEICVYTLALLSIYRTSPVEAARRIDSSRWYIVRRERTEGLRDLHSDACHGSARTSVCG